MQMKSTIETSVGSWTIRGLLRASIGVAVFPSKWMYCDAERIIQTVRRRIVDVWSVRSYSIACTSCQ